MVRIHFRAPSRSLIVRVLGTLNLAVVHLHPEKRHAVAADLGYDELVDRRHHFETRALQFLWSSRRKERIEKLGFSRN